VAGVVPLAGDGVRDLPAEPTTPTLNPHRWNFEHLAPVRHRDRLSRAGGTTGYTVPVLSGDTVHG